MLNMKARITLVRKKLRIVFSAKEASQFCADCLVSSPIKLKNLGKDINELVRLSGK